MYLASQNLGKLLPPVVAKWQDVNVEIAGKDLEVEERWT